MSMPSRLESEGALTLVVSPLIAVLAMAVGCSILDDASGNLPSDDYEPLYIACRMGALGGPIAALFCVLVSSTFVLDVSGEGEPVEIIKLRARLEGLRRFWGLVTPYMIGIGGGPIGSAILRAADGAHTIRPISAVRAAAVGGIFATPIYYIAAYLLMCILKPCCVDESEEENLDPVV